MTAAYLQGRKFESRISCLSIRSRQLNVSNLLNSYNVIFSLQSSFTVSLSLSFDYSSSILRAFVWQSLFLTTILTRNHKSWKEIKDMIIMMIFLNGHKLYFRVICVMVQLNEWRIRGIRSRTSPNCNRRRNWGHESLLLTYC